MIHISSLMSKIIKMFFYLILILRTISLIIFTYYFVLPEALPYFNKDIINVDISARIIKLQELYDILTSILGLCLAVTCVILFNPYYVIDYKIDGMFKHMLYYYGLVVIYEVGLLYFTKNRILNTS
jgi:hypothetical protein